MSGLSLTPCHSVSVCHEMVIVKWLAYPNQANYWHYCYYILFALQQCQTD